MHREGHFGLNALLYAPITILVGLLGSVELAVWGALIVVGTATIPDLDMKTPFIKHRGITHTVWFAGGLGVLTGGFTGIAALPHPESQLLVFGFAMGALGILGHVLGDMMTPMGIRPWKPLRERKYALGWFLAKNKIANYGFLAIGGVALMSSLGFVLQNNEIDLLAYSMFLFPI